MLCKPLILQEVVTKLGCNYGWTPISLEQPSDPVGRANKKSLHLRWRTYQSIETK